MVAFGDVACHAAVAILYPNMCHPKHAHRAYTAFGHAKALAFPTVIGETW